MPKFRVEKLKFDRTKCPDGRTQFGMCNSNDAIYIFGGHKYDPSLWKLNIKSMEWEKLYSIHNGNVLWPKTRSGCTLNYVNNKIYLFGGTLSMDKLLLEYNLFNSEWNVLNSLDNRTIMSHTSIDYGNFIIYFGGTNETFNECYSDTFVFDSINDKFKKISLTNKPNPRFDHGCCIAGELMFIHGGRDCNDNIIDDIYCINIKRCIHGNSKWIKVDINLPSFYGHLFLGYNSKLIMFGGISNESNNNNNNDKYNNNIMIFENTQSYTKSQNLSKLISGFIRRMERRLNIMAPKDISMMIQYFLGIIFQKKQINWISPRIGHRGCIMKIYKKPHLFVFGGIDEYSQINNDSYIIDLTIKDKKHKKKVKEIALFGLDYNINKTLSHMKRQSIKHRQSMTQPIFDYKKIFKEGWVFQQINQKWKKRFTILVNNTLYLFLTDSDKYEFSRAVNKIKLQRVSCIKLMDNKGSNKNSYKYKSKFDKYLLKSSQASFIFKIKK